MHTLISIQQTWHFSTLQMLKPHLKLMHLLSQKAPGINTLAEITMLCQIKRKQVLLFFGEANCVSCHSGNIFSDKQHYNLAVPQFRPGKDRAAPLDIGRYTETGDTGDRFAFRTPPLRNAVITGPWMHNGAFTDLKDVVNHHIDSQNSSDNYEVTQLPPELQHTFKGDDKVMDDLLKNLDMPKNTRYSIKESDVVL